MENFTPPPNLYPPKITPSKNILIQVIRANFTFWKILIFLSDLNSKIFTPGVKFFEFDNKYIIRCLLLKYRLIFLLVFLYLTRLKVRQILSRLVKNISLYFKRRHLIIYKYCKMTQNITYSKILNIIHGVAKNVSPDLAGRRFTSMGEGGSGRRPLPPQSLNILVGLTLKLLSLYCIVGLV